jgi:hypothetical protein
MRYVQIEDGVVVNATVFGAVASGGGGGGDSGMPDTMPDGWDAPNVWIASDEAQIGWTYANGQFTAPPSPPEEPAPPPELAPYQFRAMLALSGKQAALDAYIAALPDPQKTIAQAKLDYSLTFRRDNDLVLAAQQALGLTDAQLDALWDSAAQIT